MCDCQTTVEGWSSIESCRLSCPERRFEMEKPQATALVLTPNETKRFMKRIENSSFLNRNKIEVYVVKGAGCIFMQDDERVIADHVMVRANDDYALGLGVGFLKALYEGLEK